MQRLVQRVNLNEARVHGERRGVDVFGCGELRGDGLRLAGEEEDEVVGEGDVRVLRVERDGSVGRENRAL